MTSLRKLVLAALAGLVLVGMANSAQAQYGRHYYAASWNYHPTYSYYYRPYYYKPYPDYEGYRYHYSIYHYNQPRYVYYYNPYSSVYWGRYDLESKGYSLLAEKDRKSSLKEIDEKAFPTPGEMPVIPESKDGERMSAPDPKDLPKRDAPKDAPGDPKK